MKVNWDDEIPNRWENKKCSKPPTSIVFWCVLNTRKVKMFSETMEPQGLLISPFSVALCYVHRGVVRFSWKEQPKHQLIFDPNEIHVHPIHLLNLESKSWVSICMRHLPQTSSFFPVIWIKNETGSSRRIQKKTLRGHETECWLMTWCLPDLGCKHSGPGVRPGVQNHFFPNCEVLSVKITFWIMVRH